MFIYYIFVSGHLSKSRHTECSDLTEVRWALYIYIYIIYNIYIYYIYIYLQSLKNVPSRFGPVAT